MQFYTYLPILLLVIVFLLWRRQTLYALVAARRSRTKREGLHKNSTREVIEMIELAKRFLDKEVIVYTLHSQQLEGLLTEVGEGGIILRRKGGECEAVNLEYVVRIREYPRDKNGKKKSIVLD